MCATKCIAYTLCRAHIRDIVHVLCDKTRKFSKKMYHTSFLRDISCITSFIFSYSGTFFNNMLWLFYNLPEYTKPWINISNTIMLFNSTKQPCKSTWNMIYNYNGCLRLNRHLWQRTWKGGSSILNNGCICSLLAIV